MKTDRTVPVSAPVAQAQAPTGFSPATPQPDYQPPRLTPLGEYRVLTQVGSIPGGPGGRIFGGQGFGSQEGGQ
jgi:hypothetical protein